MVKRFFDIIFNLFIVYIILLFSGQDFITVLGFHARKRLRFPC